MELRDSSSACVYEISGEPAIVINGMPDVAPSAAADESIPFVGIVRNEEETRKNGFGEWMEGRAVRKLFGEEFYSGTVTKYDKETGWYRVVYEDGDLEDLEWPELDEILLPLDIAIPLKSVALKILKKSERPSLRTREITNTSRKRPGARTNNKRKATEGNHGPKTGGLSNPNVRPEKTTTETKNISASINRNQNL